MFLAAAWQPGRAQCAWQGVPTGTAAASTSTNTLYSDIAIDATTNSPYIVYCDGAATNLATVRTFSSGVWQTVGSTGNTNASYTSLAMKGSQPYIAFVDGNSGNKATVKTYSAGAWSQVGAALSTGTASYTSIWLDASGTPYVAYQDVANGNKPTVKTYSAGAWQTVGGTTASTVSCSYTYLALDHTDTPYLVYQDVTNGYKSSVKKYSGGVWSSVGPTNISTSTASYLSIDFDNNNVPYIAYEESNVATIKTFTSGSWQAVGTGTVANSYTYLNLAIDQNLNTPYITFYQTGGSYGAAVSKYFGGAWSYAGNQPFSTSGTTSYNAIAIDKNGIPYVVYNDFGVGASVKKLGSATTITLQPVSSTVTCVSASVPLSVATNTTTGLSYTWQYDAGSGFANVAGGNSQNMTVSPVTSTMSGNPYRCVIYDGCVDLISNNAILTVNVTPTVTTSNFIICNGSTAPLLANGATTYSWNTGATTNSIIVAPPTTTSYTVTGYNGPCFGMSYPTVTVNPNPPVTVTSTAVCAGGTATLNATGALTYFWSTGPNTSSLVVSPSSNTIYTATGTDANGCATSTNATVTVNPNPIAVPGTNSPACEGSPLALTESGTNGPVTWYWTGPNGFTSTAQNPVLSSSTPSMSGTYTVAVTNASSCTNAATLTAVVNPTPAITLSASSWSICIGSAATFTASGANTYTWSTGAASPSIAVTPSVNTIYSVSGTNSNGCTGSSTGTLSIISSKTFSGTVTSTAGAVSGNMILYRYTAFLSKWDSVAFTPFSSIYSFGVTDSSLYVIKAVPTATNVQVTYAPSAISWQNALVVHHGCAANTTQSLVVQPYAALTGSGAGSMSGHITEAQGFGHKTANIEAPGNPIPGVVVKGGKNPGSAIFAETVTDAAGHYAFTNVPDNNPGETYFILVDIPGLDTNQTYHEVLVAGNDNYTTLDFTVDSIEVNPVMATSVNELNKADYQVQLFPNPANTSVTLSYSLLKQSTVKIGLADLVEKHVGPAQATVSQGPGNYSQTIPVDMLSPGMYFIRISIDGNEATVKLCISR